jgi:hypothetical protein
MKKIGIIVLCLLCLSAGSSFGQGGTLNSDVFQSDSLRALKYGLSSEKDDNTKYSHWLQMPGGVLQNYIPDSLLKFYENGLNVLPFNRQQESNNWWKGDDKPGYPVPESQVPRYYDRGVPYYDRMPIQPNDRRSVPVPGFPGWKVQEIMMKSERS